MSLKRIVTGEQQHGQMGTVTGAYVVSIPVVIVSAMSLVTISSDLVVIGEP